MRQKIILSLIVFLALILRLYKLGEVPPSLYWDEASLGYNAFSVATTLRDEHGEFLPFARFIAFGDYKAPGYIYTAAGTIKLFGLSEFSVRLPSALAGTFLVLVTYFLTKELFRQEKLSLLAAFFVTISPWALQFSRAAFEANLATFFSGLGILLFLRGRYKISALSFAAAMYTFNSHRIFVPVMMAALCLIFVKSLLAQKKKFLFFVLVFAISLLPLIPHLLSREGRLRFYEVTWLNDTALVEMANHRIAADGGTWWAKIIHNRRVDFSFEFLKHYLDHFRPEFLFFSGDVNPRLSIQTVGEMYYLDLPLLLLAVFFLVKQHTKTRALLFSWILLSPIPAAFARETPHALRILQILPAPQILVALGLTQLTVVFKKFTPAVVFISGLFFAAYLHDYYIHYPIVYASDWQYGYKQMVESVSQIQGKYDHVSVTGTYGRPYIYFLFYQKYPPQKYFLTRSVDRDWYGFWYVHRFDKYVFDTPNDSGKWLFVHDAKPFPANEKLLRVIYDPSGQPVFQITEKT